MGRYAFTMERHLPAASREEEETMTVLTTDQSATGAQYCSLSIV